MQRSLQRLGLDLGDTGVLGTPSPISSSWSAPQIEKAVILGPNHRRHNNGPAIFDHKSEGIDSFVSLRAIV